MRNSTQLKKKKDWTGTVFLFKQDTVYCFCVYCFHGITFFTLTFSEELKVNKKINLKIVANNLPIMHH